MEGNAIDPQYYRTSYPFEVIDILKSMLSEDEFRGFCLGNEIKYRMRAGIKSDKIVEDITKAEWYRKARENNESYSEEGPQRCTNPRV